MIAMSEYYLVLSKGELGPETQKIIDVQRSAGLVEMIGTDGYKINNYSKDHQMKLFAAIEAALDKDFPSPCDECGCEMVECCCKDELPNATDHREPKHD